MSHVLSSGSCLHSRCAAPTSDAKAALRAIRPLSLSTLLAVVLSAACQGEGFACGEPMANNADVTYTCDRPHEACVCWTNSCAQAVTPDVCASGYAYASAPFVLSGIAPGSCVDPKNVDWIVLQGSTTTQCGSSPSTDGGTDAGTSSSLNTSSCVGESEVRP
jgi:hypothetical protein